MTSNGLGVPILEGIREGILEGKLYPAAGTASALPRTRLDGCSAVFDATHPVVTVVAPAGYGKSTLMARWHARLVERKTPCAWLSLDPDDNDRTRFVRHLVAALHKADASIGQGIAGQLAGDFTGSTKPLLESLAGDLAQLQRRVVLFLDDLQFVEQAEVLEMVDWLVNYAPRGLHYVIGSREEPRLRLSGLRVRRQLFELDARQLQFDLEEVSHFCRDRLGRALPLGSQQQLLGKTEGWPAALELAALALEGNADPTGFIEQFAGTDSSVPGAIRPVMMSERSRRKVCSRRLPVSAGIGAVSIQSPKVGKPQNV